MKNRLRFLIGNKQSFIALFVLLAMAFNACNIPTTYPARNPAENNINNITPRYFYVDSNGNYTDTDMGRTVLVADDKTYAVFYSDDIESNADRVGFTFEGKNLIFFFEKDQNFPTSIAISDSEGTYTGTFTSYDTVHQTYGLTIGQGDDEEIYSGIALSKDTFTQYKDDAGLSTSQNLRMRNMYIAMCIYTSLYDFIAPDAALHARGVFSFLNKITKVITAPVAKIVVGAAQIIGGVAQAAGGVALLVASGGTTGWGFVYDGIVDTVYGVINVINGINQLNPTFNSVTQNGSPTQTTTQLTLNFNQAIAGLNASDITLSGVSGITKGTLSGAGPTYTLPISGFSSGGTLNVVVAKSGYNISGSPKTATVYYYLPPVAVTFNSVTANGSTTQTTTQLTLNFSQAINGLTASDITLSGVSGVTKGTLGGSGPTYTLPISGFTSGGTLSVAVANLSGYSVSGSPKTTTVYYIANVTLNNVTQNGSSTQTTTLLTLAFSQAVTGLTANYITISGVSGVTKGTLGGTGPTYTLPISGFTAGGTLNVAVTSPPGYNVSGSPKTATVYYYATTTSTATLTITFTQITDVAPSITGPTLYRVSNGGPTSATLSVANPAQYDSIAWRVQDTTVTGTGSSFTLSAANTAYNLIGEHFVTVSVMKGGAPYNKTVSFRVEY